MNPDFEKANIIILAHYSLYDITLLKIKANEVVPNDPSSSNQQAPVYHQQASSSLTNFNWLPGADTPTQYVSIHVIWVVKLSGRRSYYLLAESF